jgi:hypothetical protein
MVIFAPEAAIREKHIDDRTLTSMPQVPAGEALKTEIGLVMVLSKVLQ